MEKRKKFTSASMPEIFYEVVGEGWMDKDTYVIVFQTMTDVDGDDFHTEVEYHKDENEIVYTRCYDDEVMDGTMYVSPCFKRQIEEYTLQQVGVLRKGSSLYTQNVSLELELDIPQDTYLEEFNDWFSTLKFEVVHTMTPKDEKIKLLSIKNKGIKR